MASAKLCFFVLIFFVISLESTHGWRSFWKGRRFDGNLIPPPANVSREHLPPDQWIDQKLDHFNESNTAVWKQVRN